MVGFPPALDKRVTPDNLYLYPFNRWTLQSTRRFTRTASTLTERKEAQPIPEKLDNALLTTNLHDQRRQPHHCGLCQPDVHRCSGGRQGR